MPIGNLIGNGGCIVSNVVLNSSLLAEIAQSFSPAEQLMADLNQLAQDLKSGNLPAVQQDYVTLSQDLADTANPGSASAAESGVIVSLLTDLASWPTDSTESTPTEVPGQLIPRTGGFNYVDSLFPQKGTPQDRASQDGASSMGSAAAAPASSTGASSVPQSGVSNLVAPPSTAQSADPAHGNAKSVQAVNGAIVGNADSLRAPSSAGSASSSISDEGGQDAAMLGGSSSASGNPLIPGLNPDSSGVLPWNLFEWQLSSYRSQPIPSEFLRKRKSPRGSATRTRTRRRKP